MCYSAKVATQIRQLERKLGVSIDADWPDAAFWLGQGNPPRRPSMPRALEREALANAPPAIADAVAMADKVATDQLTRQVFLQRKRVADAERALQKRDTKKARQDIRIGNNKIAAAMRLLDELRPPSGDGGWGRIYPNAYCLVVVKEGARHVARLMRYRCRLPGWTPAIERRYPGTYNARRDNLEKSWARVFGHTHGVILASAFYEHVQRDGRNQVLEFRPGDGSQMILACLWTRSTGPDGSALYSFAAITDEPPAEVAAAGHDRCIIPIRRQHLDGWLSPDAGAAGDRSPLHAILDDRERPCFEHRQAA